MRSQWTFGCFHKFALAIYTDFRALSPECTRAQNNELTQHRLNMASVSNRWQQYNYAFLPTAQLVSNALDNINGQTSSVRASKMVLVVSFLSGSSWQASQCSLRCLTVVRSDGSHQPYSSARVSSVRSESDTL